MNCLGCKKEIVFPHPSMGGHCEQCGIEETSRINMEQKRNAEKPIKEVHISLSISNMISIMKGQTNIICASPYSPEPNVVIRFDHSHWSPDDTDAEGNPLPEPEVYIEDVLQEIENDWEDA